MAAPKPVPSRAALNALRGLVFTTSCSVILLAEERRRRTKVARAAIDNARKLHTVKAHRRPLAMFDSRLSESELELLSFPQATDAPRRRKRRSPPDQNPPAKNSKEADSAATKAADTRHLDSASNLAFSSPRSSKNDLATPCTASSSNDGISGLIGLPAGTRPPKTLSSALERPLDESSLHRRLRTEPLKPQAREAMEAGITKATTRVLSAIDAGDKRHLDPLSAEVLDYLQMPPCHDAWEKLGPRQFFPRLKRLLEKLESHGIDRAMSANYQKLGLLMFKKVVSEKPPTTSYLAGKKLRFYCLRLLKVIIRSDPAQLGAALDVVLPLYTDVTQLSSSLLHWLTKINYREGVQHLLQYLSEQDPQTFTLDESSAVQLLEDHAKRFKSPPDTRRVYDALRNAGLSRFLELTPHTEYILHRDMLQMAYQHGNLAMCLDEARELRTIDLERTSNDPEIRGALLFAEVSSQAASVEAGLQKLEETAALCSEEYLSMLSGLVDAWAKRLKPQAFEEVIRSLVDKHRIPLKNKWVYSILEHHSFHLDQEAMLSWLQFCFQRDYQPDEAFFQKFYHILWKRWQVSNEEITYFYEVLREAVPSLPPPASIPEANSSQGYRESGSRRKHGHEDWETMYIRSTEKHGSGESCLDEGIFKSMQAHAFRGDWEKAWVSYEATYSSTPAPSVRCLRLAILARVKLDKGATDQASRLIEESQERGVDVSEAMTPLLMAHIAAGRDASEVVHDTLRRGFRIHDMVYNMAAQSACNAGQQSEAIEICKTAAAQNGKGDLVYSLYNFANLVFAYTSLAAYKRLETLLTNFTSEKRWWAGSHVSIQAMKLAMKLVAKRTVVANTKQAERRHEAALVKLNTALNHGLQCKQSPDTQMSMMDSLAEIFHPTKSETGDVPTPSDNEKSTKTTDVPHASPGFPASRSNTEPRKSTPVRYVTVQPRKAQNGDAGVQQVKAKKMPLQQRAAMTSAS